MKSTNMKLTNVKTQEIVKSRKFKIAALIVGVVLVALISFAGGMFTGLHKAKYSYRWGENYEKNFVGPRIMPVAPSHLRPKGNWRRSFYDFEGRNFRNANGLSGSILSISDNNLVIKDKDNKENTITVTDKTIIKKWGQDLTVDDLKVDDQVVVIGSPDQNGTISASLIRVFQGNPPSDNGNSNNNNNNNLNQ